MTSRLAAPLALLALVSATAAAAQGGKGQSSKKKKPVPTLNVRHLGAPLLIVADKRDESSWTERLSATAPAVEGLVAPPRYVVGREGSASTGKRATLSVDLGETRLFAVGGKLRPRERAGADEVIAVSDARSIGARKLESGKLYGGGVQRRLGPVEVGAEYQFSTISATDLDPSSQRGSLYEVDLDGSRRSHSVKASAKLRF